MALGPYRTSALSEQDRQQRRRLLSMTLITCLVLALIGGTIHVVMLGKLRLGDMRRMATYDLSEESTRVRAAGEEITLHQKHETGPIAAGYNVVEAERLVGREEWEDLDRMMLVPGGRFIMGTDLDRADEQDKPRHVVVLPAYYLDRYLVTNAQYARFVASTGRRAPLNWKGGRIPQGELLKPVSMVAWDDAAGYCAWAGRRASARSRIRKGGARHGRAALALGRQNGPDPAQHLLQRRFVDERGDLSSRGQHLRHIRSIRQCGGVDGGRYAAL